MSLLVKGQPDGGFGRTVAVGPESGLEHVGFEVHVLAAGQTASFRGEGREHCVVVLSGRIDATAGDRRYEDVGERADVFAGAPSAIFAPAGCDIAVGARTRAEVAICWSPVAAAGPALEPYRVDPAEVAVEVRGSGAMERRIQPIVMEDRPAASLLVVEVLTPGGHWSSYPPHKHDVEDPPRETRLEETYYHRVRPVDGFGLQRVYTADRELDETVAFGDGDVVLVPRGYHTVSAAPGYDLYYLNVMAGPLRHWAVRDDPDHAWLRR